MWKTSKKKYFEIRNKILMRKIFPPVKNYFQIKTFVFNRLIHITLGHIVFISDLFTNVDKVFYKFKINAL